MRNYSTLFAASILLSASHSTLAQNSWDQDQISRLVRFLVSDCILTPNLSGNLVPLSFYVGDEEEVASYFGDYLLARQNLNPGLESLVNAGLESPINPGLESRINRGLESPVNPGLESRINRGLESPVNPGLESPINPGLESRVNRGLESPVNPGLESPINPGLESRVNRGLESPLNPGLESRVNRGLESPVNPGLESPINPGLASDVDNRGGDWRQLRAQLERTTLKYGSDIYHAATWQIALALAAENGFLEAARARKLIANQLETITNPINRAFGPNYRYGQLPILDSRLAFTYRWLTNQLYNRDPLYNSRYQNQLSWNFSNPAPVNTIPELLPTSLYPLVRWADYQPLTGKNAWAQLIGPLQAEYLLNKGLINPNSPALINAINSLTAFSLLQTGIGAFYYAPTYLVAEGRQTLIPSSLILIEDNFAVLAGLQLLKANLVNTVRTAEVNQALARIEVMLHGGLTLNGFRTRGLLSFLFNGAFDREANLFYTSGTVSNQASTTSWRPNPSNFAGFTTLNTNLLALSALGVETIDSWFGEGRALKIWQIVRQRSGYFAKGELWGFGYSLNNNSGMQSESLMTTEGSAAAINAVYSLIDFYGDKRILLRDRESMEQNIQRLRSDLYLDSNFLGAAASEFLVNLPTENGQAYLQASKRFPIPLDWNTHPLVSTNANAWILMNYFKFNPLQYKGRFAGENYPRPDEVDIFDRGVVLAANSLARQVVVRFNAADLGNFDRMTIKYNIDGSETNWLISLITNQDSGFITLPQGTRTIAISFVNADLDNACQIIPARDLCIDPDCMNVRSIRARLNSNGLGSCELF